MSQSPPKQARRTPGRAQPLEGGCHGYWEDEAICVEMKVSMTLWLDGSRWLWPLLESELWYNTRLLEDTAGASETAGCLPSPSRPHGAHPAQGYSGQGTQGLPPPELQQIARTPKPNLYT